VTVSRCTRAYCSITPTCVILSALTGYRLVIVETFIEEVLRSKVAGSLVGNSTYIVLEASRVLRGVAGMQGYVNKE
jgi:hypothetical protein